MGEISSALRDAGIENWQDNSSQDVQRVSPTGPPFSCTPAMIEGAEILRIDKEFLSKKKSFSSLGRCKLCLRLSLVFSSDAFGSRSDKGSKLRWFLKLCLRKHYALPGQRAHDTGQMLLLRPRQGLSSTASKAFTESPLKRSSLKKAGAS